MPLSRTAHRQRRRSVFSGVRVQQPPGADRSHRRLAASRGDTGLGWGAAISCCRRIGIHRIHTNGGCGELIDHGQTVVQFHATDHISCHQHRVAVIPDGASLKAEDAPVDLAFAGEADEFHFAVKHLGATGQIHRLHQT